MCCFIINVLNIVFATYVKFCCMLLIVMLTPVPGSPPRKRVRRNSLSESCDSSSLYSSPISQNTGLPTAKHGDQPDADAIKMFIGQIPKTWGETEVRELLEVYGPIYQLNILREKGSVLSKGKYFYWLSFCSFNKIS